MASMALELPPGPKDYPETMRWASYAVCQVVRKQAAARDRLASHGCNGIWTTSHFSGMGTVETAWPFISQELQRQGICAEPEVRHKSACDVDSTCIQVLCGHAKQSRPEHVMIDLSSRVPVKLFAALERLLTHFVAQKQDSLAAAAERGVSGDEARITRELGKRFLQQAQIDSPGHAAHVRA